MNKGLLLVLVTALILVLVFALKNWNKPVPPHERVLDDVYEEVHEFRNSSVLAKKIESMHNELNQIACWGRHKAYDDPDYEGWIQHPILSDPDYMDSVFDLLRNAEGFYEDIRTDLLVFEAYLKLAREEKKGEHLVSAHRVIHDLDYWVFGDEEKRIRGGSTDYFGATTVLEGSNKYYQEVSSMIYDYTDVLNGCVNQTNTPTN